MADGSFPFGAVGLVHVENRIVQRRPIAHRRGADAPRPPDPAPAAPQGRTFSLRPTSCAGDEVVWDEVSTMLRRGSSATEPESPRAAEGFEPLQAGAPASAEWRLGGDLGRRYGAVSGDRNPIHLHALTAKPLGFPGAIAHGMWTMARCLAALESRLPDAFAVDVRFRKPILLPSRVDFASADRGEERVFSVRDAKRGTPHLDGRLRTLDAVGAGRKPTKARTGRKGQ